MPPKDVPRIETFVKTDDGRVINMADIKTINIVDEKLSEYIFALSTNGYRDSDGLVTITGRCTGEKIIRCRNCTHYEEFTLFGKTAYLCKREITTVSAEPNGYCNFGIEKEDK